jgi:hypothetical protein
MGEVYHGILGDYFKDVGVVRSLMCEYGVVCHERVKVDRFEGNFEGGLVFYGSSEGLKGCGREKWFSFLKEEEGYSFVRGEGTLVDRKVREYSRVF